jgi:hypothetical protein
MGAEGSRVIPEEAAHAETVRRYLSLTMIGPGLSREAPGRPRMARGKRLEVGALHRQVDNQHKCPIPGSPWDGHFALSFGSAPHEPQRPGGGSSTSAKRLTLAQ